MAARLESVLDGSDEVEDVGGMAKCGSLTTLDCYSNPVPLLEAGRSDRDRLFLDGRHGRSRCGPHPSSVETNHELSDRRIAAPTRDAKANVGT